MNLVERWFAELANLELRHPAHHRVTELEAGIRKWFGEWNRDPKLFVWTKPPMRSRGNTLLSADE
jgi:hypothetical protein